MEIDVIADRQSLTALSAAWRDFEHARQSPLADFPWLCAAFDCLSANRLHVVLARRDGVLVAAAPLAVGRRFGIERAQLVGVEALYEPAGILYQDEAAAVSLSAALISIGKPIVLQRVCAEDVGIAAFVARAKSHGMLIRRPAAAAPYVDIVSDWDTYVAGLSSRRRYDYRRNRKRLQAQGAVRVEHHPATPETVASLFDRFVAVEAASWKSAAGGSLRVNPELLAFFSTVARSWSEQGNLRISFLTLGSDDLAAVLWVVHANRAWVLKIGYDERKSEASPGIQLLWDVLQVAFEKRLASFEFLGSDEPWLSIWTTGKRRYETVVFYPYNSAGGLAFATDAAASLWRRAKRMFAKP